MSWLTDDIKELTQGSVVDNVPWAIDPAPLGIVLSNPCDLEWGKASFILIAALVPAQGVISLSKEFEEKVKNADDDKKLTRKNWESMERYLGQFINNVNIARYFFIDPSLAFEAPPLFVDYQNLIVVPKSQKDKLVVLGSLPPPFKEKMIMHYSSYTSRVGVDRVTEEKKQEFINKLASPYHS